MVARNKLLSSPQLLIALPDGACTPRNKLQTLTGDLALMYANRQDKAVSHDTNRLKQLGLLTGDARRGYKPRIERMDAFMPRIPELLT